MKIRFIILFGFLLPNVFFAQDDFNKSFCNGLKELTKKVKKNKIERVKYNDTTYAIAGKLNGVEKSKPTNFEFVKGTTVFQVNLGTPMTGDNIYTDVYQLFYAAFYIGLDDSKVNGQMVDLLSRAYDAADSCNCRRMSSEAIPEKIVLDKKQIFMWDCGNKGKLSFIYSTYELSKGVADFKSWFEIDLNK